MEGSSFDTNGTPGDSDSNDGGLDSIQELPRKIESFIAPKEK